MQFVILFAANPIPPRTLEEELAALKRNRLTKFSAALETALS